MGRWKRGEQLVMNDAGEIQGIIYCYRNENPDAGEEFGWHYVDYTDKELLRKNNWNSEGHYAGKKIDEAREKWGIKNFKYGILEVIYDKDQDKLEERMRELEGVYIRKLDAVEHGYNGNYGGSGKTGMHCSEETKAKMRMSMPHKRSVIAIDPETSEETCYDSFNVAAAALNVNVGNIHYHALKSKSHTLNNGYKLKIVI